MTLSLSLFPLGWQHYLAGGLLAGAGVALLFVLTGRIGGMSTVFSSTWSYAVQRPFFQQARFVDSRGWRLVYAAGLILGRCSGGWAWPAASRRPRRCPPGSSSWAAFSWAMARGWAMAAPRAMASAGWVRCSFPL
jgi:hypothetical protein